MTDAVEKARVLMAEAESDLTCGNYNKAVSAAYFAVRMLAEAHLPGLRTTKDVKIANALRRSLEPLIGKRQAREAAKKFLELFTERKRADHRPHLFGGEEAARLLREARELSDLIVRELGRRGGRAR